MTTQIPETLLYRGENHYFDIFPLNQYFELAEIINPFDGGVGVCYSDCWNGYVASWSIENNRLYITHLSTTGRNPAASLEDLFPGCGGKVFAHWYSGAIKLPIGKVVAWDELEAVYDRSLILIFLNGVLKYRSEFENKITYISYRGSSPIPPPPKGSNKVDASGRPIVMQQNLIARFSIKDVETAETPNDPSGYVPSVVFGLMNSQWQSFLKTFTPESELWSFAMTYREYAWTDEFDKQFRGFACVDNGIVKSAFVSSAHYQYALQVCISESLE